MSRPALSPLTLGTAQFGSRYGFANVTGCPDDAELLAILSTAERAGITYFDTARAYGNAEERLGSLLPEERRAPWGKISKVAPLAEFMQSAAGEDAAAAVRRSIDMSLAALRTEHIDIVMFHRFEDMLEPGALEALAEQVTAGRVGAAGVSVYTPEEAMRALAEADIRHIQIPFNLVDGRWLAPEFQSRLAERPEVSIHARSVYLQGLLLYDADRWPAWMDAAPKVAGAIARIAGDLGCSRAELCLRYHRSFPWLATTVLGVDTASHLEAAAAASQEPLDERVLAQMRDLAEITPVRLLNPLHW